MYFASKKPLDFRKLSRLTKPRYFIKHPPWQVPQSNAALNRHRLPTFLPTLFCWLMKNTQKFFLCSLYLGLFFSCSSSSSSSPELSSFISLSSAWIPPFLLFFLLPLFFLKIKKETIFETKSRKISSLKAEPEPSAFFYWNCGRPSAFWLEPEPPCFGRSLSYPVLAGA